MNDLVRLRQLEIFSVVGSQLNLTAAAEHLRIAQPAISVQLRLLEQQFGTKLYNPTGRGIELTAAGAVLLKEAKRILCRIADVNRV